MRHDQELSLDAVRRSASEPRDVTADRALLVALILGPSLLVLAVLWSGFDAKSAEIEAALNPARICTGFCAQGMVTSDAETADDTLLTLKRWQP